MKSPQVDKNRGIRLKHAMETRGYRKATALAASLDISPAAITKWTQGHAMSLDHVANLAHLLDVSLDWLLMGRNEPDWLRQDQLTAVECEIIEKMRARPPRLATLLSRLLGEIPAVMV